MKFIPELNGHLNAIIQGENDEVMRSLLERGFKGKFKMIYFDGPFNSGLVFSLKNEEFGFNFINPWSELETVRHYFHRETYLECYRKRIELARQLLREDGTFVLQTNQLSGHHVKVLIDDIFGSENFLNEVIWKHSSLPWPNPFGSSIGYQHETLLFYSKSQQWVNTVENIYPSVWDDIGGYDLGSESTNYPSQKPERLLERILDITSSEGDLVGDFYCGSGTFPCVASKKQRSWIASDNNPLSIEITENRVRRVCSSFQTCYAVEPYSESQLSGNEYTKLSNLPFSLLELKGLPAAMEVNAYSFLPEVDLHPNKKQYQFNYLFPLITKKGFVEKEVIKIPRPIPEFHSGHYRLKVAKPYEWVFYHLVHLKTNGYAMLDVTKYDKSYEHIFLWEQVNQLAEEVVNKIKDQWITDTKVYPEYTQITDAFGYRYHIRPPKEI